MAACPAEFPPPTMKTFLPIHMVGFGARRSVDDTAPQQTIRALHFQPAPVDAGCQQHHPRLHPLTAVQLQHKAAAVCVSFSIQRVIAISAPKRIACLSARVVRSSPETPSGNPR